MLLIKVSFCDGYDIEFVDKIFEEFKFISYTTNIYIANSKEFICIYQRCVRNDIECDRAAIGLFNLCKWNHVRSYKCSCTSILEILLTNFRCTFLVASLTVLQSVNPHRLLFSTNPHKTHVRFRKKLSTL
jgi:hypothetical protein